MSTARNACRLITSVLCLALTQPVSAYKDAVGFERLKTSLGRDAPTGNGVRVALVESSVIDKTEGGDFRPRFGPDVSNKGLVGKVFRPAPTIDAGFSPHATNVANLFFGRHRSMAPDIARIDLLETRDFLQRLGRSRMDRGAMGSTARVWSHSWVGDGGPQSGALLTRLDAVARDHEWLVICGVRNKGRNSPFLSAAFNVISVGMSNGRHAKGSARVNTLYGAGRTRPHLVTPLKTSSSSVPLVAAAAALLIQTGRDAALSRDPVETFAVIDKDRRVYNGERASVVTAALLAGARRRFDLAPAADTDAPSRPPAWRERPAHRTRNGMDRRFGAGQLDVLNSYRIIAAGEYNSIEDDADAMEIPASGFDFDPAFGGAGDSNRLAHYEFAAPRSGRFIASLVWPAEVVVAHDEAGERTVVRNLDIRLVALAPGEHTVASSTDDADNNEHIFAVINAGHRYRLEVAVAGDDAFLWQYALAWRMSHGTPRAAH